mmetsp:Transcript_62249/g.145977  ORF Transcript_62249/g.145977 Transcript_62249/m.145977 type:complete len:204 (-) Transcript_62249:627-1238(-)
MIVCKIAKEVQVRIRLRRELHVEDAPQPQQICFRQPGTLHAVVSKDTAHLVAAERFWDLVEGREVQQPSEARSPRAFLQFGLVSQVVEGRLTKNLDTSRLLDFRQEIPFQIDSRVKADSIHTVVGHQALHEGQQFGPHVRVALVQVPHDTEPTCAKMSRIKGRTVVARVAREACAFRLFKHFRAANGLAGAQGQLLQALVVLL